MEAEWTNKLYYGDNLQVLREHVADETVDLIYLDPPFNSQAAYNVLFAEENGSKSHAQIQAFDDTWHWDEAAAQMCEDVVELGGRAADAMLAFRKLLGGNDMMAYLAMMAPRLMELRRVLKPTGSIYLHCDPTASHYLKVLMDGVFGPESFRNEITWKRTSSHSDARRRYADITDILFFYTKTAKYTFHVQYVPYSQTYIDTFYVHQDPDGRRWRRGDLRSPSPRPNLTYDYKGWKPHKNGWSVSRERMEQLDREGRLHYPKDPNGRIQLKRYLDEQPGMPVTCWWDDIPPIHALTAERLGYQTQKPELLLERVIKASSNEGDLVLDPFCGCGTTVAVAERLHRRWIGIDITHLAITLMKERLEAHFGGAARYEVVGEPTSVPDAQALAASSKYQFQWWALGKVGARPTEQKKGADRGIDGRIFFHDEPVGGKAKEIIISVKGGGVTVKDVRDLGYVVDREGAVIGVLITMEPPTRPMKKEAAGAGFYVHPLSGARYPKLQIVTVEDLIAKKRIDRPYADQPTATFKQAPKVRWPKPKQPPLPVQDSKGD